MVPLLLGETAAKLRTGGQMSERLALVDKAYYDILESTILLAAPPLCLARGGYLGFFSSGARRAVCG